jgi:hypothetical protein
VDLALQGKTQMASRLFRRIVHATALVAALTPIACSRNDAAPTTPTPPAAASVTSIAVTGSAPPVGLTAQFTATATLSNGTTQNVTSQATWQSSNPAVATVTSAGVVTGVTPGEVDITATNQTIAGRARVTVVPAAYSVSGVVTDATSGGVLPNINMQITSGPSAGTSTKTDGSGAYTLGGVLTGAMNLSASATSYQTFDKAVTVVGNTRVDFVLVRVPSCSYTLSLTSQNVPAAGGTFSITATNTGDACAWTATTSTPWITLGTTSGTSPGTITFTAAANSAAAPRTGTIHVSWPGGSADSTVTQAGAPCTFDLNPAGGNFAAAGGTGSFTVTPSDAACGWTATSDSSWLTIVTGQNGTGPGTVSYAAQSYAGPVGPRVGTILITGVVSGLRGFPVQQQPPP